MALSLPNPQQTVHLMNRERFAAMKKGSILLSIGRGTAIDQDALFDALRSGPLAGASIDMTGPDSLPADIPLWKCSNLLITPHVAGGHHLQETLDQIAALFIENPGRFADGRELLNPVSRRTGYKDNGRVMAG